ncbi:MAG: deoxyguanosinetriphosphate triphosphohydrolase [Rubrivivax sp.]
MNARALAPWASDPSCSRGRRMAEPPSPPRNEHQRDRDRIVHSTAFRRLIYKTQVFINHEGDLFRTRLTHSLEVAQLARSAARTLRLNEDLVEAIALAHDLGHTPFGHAGQDALAACMAGHGGFEHNLQSLRVVDWLEVRYPGFDGLNLSFETREGILKHCSQRNARLLLAQEADGPALRFLQGTQPSLEAQLVNLADAMAYNAHDIDDGLRSGLLDVPQMMAVPLFARWHAAVLAQHPALASEAADGQSGKRLVFEILRRMLSEQVDALVRHTSAAIARRAPRDADAVRALPPLVTFGAELEAEMAALKSFLFGALYRHPQVEAMTGLARTVVTDLYAAYRADPLTLPASAAVLADTTDAEDYEPGDGGAARSIADYIAGMTDRYALREHHRLTGRRLFAD